MINVEFWYAEGLLIRFDAENEREAVTKLAFFQSLPKACPLCQAALTFFYKVPQGNEYWGMRCNGKPRHEANFGVHREGKTLYYKGDGAWDVEYSERVNELPQYAGPPR